MDLFEIALEHDHDSYKTIWLGGGTGESPCIPIIDLNDLDCNETLAYFYKQLKRVSSIPLKRN